MGQIIDDLKSFYDKYNRYEDAESEFRNITTKDIPRFPLLIHNIVTKANQDETKANFSLKEYESKIIKIIIELTEYITHGDMLLDSYFAEDSYENYLKAVDRITKITVMPWKISRDLNVLPFDYTHSIVNYLSTLLKTAKFEIEILQKYRIYSEEELHTFKESRNSDYFLYLSIVIPFFKEDVGEMILEFFMRYATFDNILDDICDIEDDYKNRSFNFLLYYSKHRNNFPKAISEFQKTLIDDKTYDYVLDLAQKYADETLKIIEGRNSELVDFLRFLIESAMAGVTIFKDHMYFKDFIEKNSLHSKIRNLLLKPYPWSCVSFNEIKDHMK